MRHQNRDESVSLAEACRADERREEGELRGSSRRLAYDSAA
jgi:hypothetical protein